MRSNELEIRFLNGDDAREWHRLRPEALGGDPEAFSASLEEYQSLSLEEVKGRLWSDPDAFVVGGFAESRLIGVAGFYREKDLKTRHKGRVWGTLLERGTAIEGVEQVLLSVATTQTAAVGLYRSLGFAPYGREPRALKIGDRFIDPNPRQASAEEEQRGEAGFHRLLFFLLFPEKIVSPFVR